MSAIRHRRRGKIPTAKQPSVSVFQSSRNFDGTSKRGSVGGSSRTGLTGVRVSGAEADAILQELANTDDYNKKTWSRMVVESFLSKVNKKKSQRIIIIMVSLSDCRFMFCIS